MKRLAMIAVFLGLAAGWTAAQDADKAKKELEGEYTLKEGSKGGKAIPEEEKKKFEKLVIKGDQITVVEGGKEDPAKFKIDPTKTPAHIDVMPSGDTTIKGIYKFEKGELTMVFTTEGDRPADFKGAGEKDMKLVVVKKEKAK